MRGDVCIAEVLIRSPPQVLLVAKAVNFDRRAGNAEGEPDRESPLVRSR